VSEERTEPAGSSDTTAPKCLLNVLDWAALYPTLTLRTVALSFAEANNARRGRHLIGDRNTILTQLITARLENFSAQRRSYEPDQPAH
jgi:hypothetical protein